MNKAKFLILGLAVCIFMTPCGVSAAEDAGADYGMIKSDLSGVTPEIAAAYLSVMDDLAGHLGYEESEASGGEYLHGGFVHDWDNDGTPELCLLLRTSPRDPDSWDGTPVYGWFAPTLYLYTYQDGQAVRAGECELYFGTVGREAAVAALVAESGMQYVWWERDELAEESFVSCYELVNGAMQKTEVPADLADAAQGAETAQAFLDAPGAGTAQLLLYNNSGEVKIEGGANARELRAALAEK